MPAEVFQTRLAAVRDQMERQNLDALVIYGDNYSFADLCYLTNYFPKVRGGIAVVPWEGAVSMLLNIGSRDVPFAKTLTWVEDVRASNQVGADGAKNAARIRSRAVIITGLRRGGRHVLRAGWRRARSCRGRSGAG